MARSLAEYSIAFAWLAAADGEERQRRLDRFVKNEFVLRERSENKLKDQMGSRTIYAALFESGRLPTELLNEETRARLASLKADTDLASLPNAFDMAFAADERWMSEIELLAHNPFALIYFTLFAGPSFSTHPSVTAVAKMGLGTPPNLVVGAAEPLGVSEMPYGQSFLTFVNMLLVAARVLGWPEEAQIHSVLNRT